MPFPIHRPRRLRKNQAILRMVRETDLSPDDLIHPMFVCEGKDKREPISSMQGVVRQSVDKAVVDAKETHKLHILAVILFGIPDKGIHEVLKPVILMAWRNRPSRRSNQRFPRDDGDFTQYQKGRSQNDFDLLSSGSG